MTKDDPNLITGVAWYRREQWPRLQKVAADPGVIEDTYDEWLRGAQEAMLDFASQGLRVERVDVDIEELVKWCRANSRRVDSSARAAFASQKLQERHERGGEGNV